MLPAAVRDYIDERFRQILSGEDASEDFSHLTSADRQAIREILAGTLEKTPAWLHASAIGR
jgi:hypothetical protein